MSDSNPTLWNLTKPKHPEVDGSIVQICGEPIRQSTFNWIKAGNLAGIVGVDFNGHLHYVWNPQIVNNLTGQPTKIIGNASNKKGEFSLIELNLGALKYFVLPMLKTQAPDGMHSGTTLTKVIYKDTKWKDNDEGTMVVSIIPKILPIFFGMDVPYGSLHEEDVAVLFSNLGTAYEAYVNAVLAHQTGNTSEHADTVVQVLKGMADGLAEFVDAQIPTRKEIGVNGPTIATIHANSSKYPEIAETIGKFFANSGGSNLSSSILGAFYWVRPIIGPLKPGTIVLAVAKREWLGSKKRLIKNFIMKKVIEVKVRRMYFSLLIERYYCWLTNKNN